MKVLPSLQNLQGDPLEIEKKILKNLAFQIIKSFKKLIIKCLFFNPLDFLEIVVGHGDCPLLKC